jgi:hypothetical protein
MKYAMPLLLSLIGWIVLMGLNSGLSENILLVMGPLLTAAGLVFSCRFMRIKLNFSSRLVVTLSAISFALMLILFWYVFMLGSGWNH